MVPALIFCFSLISSVYQLDTDALSLVLERDEEVAQLLLELHTKVVRRLHHLGKDNNDVRRAFADMDEDGSGEISKSEFRHSLQSLNIFLSQASLDRLFRAMDQNQNDQLEYAEFERLLFPEGNDPVDSKFSTRIKVHSADSQHRLNGVEISQAQSPTPEDGADIQDIHEPSTERCQT